MKHDICGRDLTAIQFLPDKSRGFLVWIRDMPHPIEGCRFQVRLIPDHKGFIAELWNWQDDEPDSKTSVGLPRLLTDMSQVLTLLDLCGVSQPALRG